MVKGRRILLLTFYYEPDLCACSFRATAFIDALRNVISDEDQVDIVTTFPNRYSSYKVNSKAYEEKGNVRIHRIKLRSHKSGFLDQAFSFSTYFFKSLSITKGNQYDLVIATSSRLFTAFLGAYVSQRIKTPLYLDIRDIFTDSMNDVLKSNFLKFFLMPILYRVENYSFRKASHINLVSEGFSKYFQDRYNKEYSYFTNGIDDVFLNFDFERNEKNDIPVITYAGNIGEGQGLHIIIPEVAKSLEGEFKFVIIGGGGAKEKLIDTIRDHNVSNVEIVDPVSRDILLEYYRKSDYLFLHLNKYKAFEKVLPSKVFEYGATNKPIIAGVSGYAAKFVKENVSDSILFEPGDVTSFVNQIRSFRLEDFERNKFINKYKRSNVMKKMVSEIYKKFLS